MNPHGKVRPGQMIGTSCLDLRAAEKKIYPEPGAGEIFMNHFSRPFIR